ncbi:MAG: electron transfer flavoprotein subunit alpha/FixB family protein [Chloroflexia bacterium]|nr:electron transfer flavoprotein subunit alpha/FixB family protein [Chloroflexia bacterium]
MSSTDILVIGEHHNGKLRAVCLEMITAAHRLADEKGGEVVVAVPGSDVAGIASELARIEGVDRIVVVEHDELTPFLPGPWVGAVTSLIRNLDPSAVLLPSSITGRDYAARVSARLDVALVPDATGLTLDAGRLVATRVVLGGRVQTSVSFPGSAPALVTVAPGAFPRAEPGTSSAPIESIEVSIDPDDLRASLVEKSEHRAGAKGLTSAARIVSGGRGLGKAENFALVEELAEVLDAAVGASGATVGAGWRSHADQVGSTGHTVTPKLYLAVGISGAPQHLVGMSGADHIVAINRDPDAPIFKVASFGIVGDLFEVVPALIRQLKAMAD